MLHASATFLTINSHWYPHFLPMRNAPLGAMLQSEQFRVVCSYFGKESTDAPISCHLQDIHQRFV